jgi:hypothetical protein
MLGRSGNSNLRSRIGALAIGLFVALGVPGAAAQERAPQPAQPAAVPAERGTKPGVFEAIGRWLDQGARNLRDQVRGVRTRVDDLNDRAAVNRKEMNERAAEVAKGAAGATIGAMEAVTKLPNARIMIGRERCTVAPNGAPDCIAAAEALCRKHGFASGKSIDFTSAEECPARVLIDGRAADVECRTVTFISRAMCQ